jgi:glycosyltransferase involved in cell wall biosynthesis
VGTIPFEKDVCDYPASERSPDSSENIRALSEHWEGRSWPVRSKVVFIGRSPWGGGAERVTWDLLHALNPHRHELHFVHLFRHQGPPVRFDPGITVHDVQARHVRPALWQRLLRRSANLLRRSSRLPADPFVQAMQERGPQVAILLDVLESIGPDSLLVPVMEEAAVLVWLAQSFGRRPYIASLHTAESLYVPMMYSDRGRLMLEQFLLGCACRDAAVVTFPGQGCKDDLVQNFHVPEGLVEVVPNPVDVEAILRRNKEDPEVPLPEAAGRHLFVHAARLSAEKNHELLLQACRLLRQRREDFLVACLGDGELRQPIRQRIIELGLQDHVVLLGAVENPYAYMARADGVLLTSRFESFALVLAEALACGAVPLSVDCPYGPREVLDGGRHGLLVPVNDPAALAGAMDRVARDRELRERARKGGPARARHYERERIAALWEALLDRVAIPAGKLAAAA